MSLAIVGDPDDLTAVYLRFRAEQRGAPVTLLAESGLGRDWRIVFDDAAPRDDHLELADTVLPLGRIDGAYVRFSHAPALPDGLDLAPADERLYHTQRRLAIHALLARLPCLVANPPGAGHANGSKPYQMRLLAGFGLEAPDWLVSNDADAVGAFAAGWRDGAVVKSCSGLRSQVRLLGSETLERLAEGSAPVLVQRRIPGRDVRIHVVGQQAFATFVDAPDAVDYRFEGETARYAAGAAPAAVVERCVAFARSERLLIAGFDFRVDADDTWWCLECNPAPTFMPYELTTHQAIADALLDCLLPA